MYASCVVCWVLVQVRAFVADPLCFVGNVRARTANEFLKGFRDVQRKEAQLVLPILAMHGTADKITSCLVRALHQPSPRTHIGNSILRKAPKRTEVYRGYSKGHM